MRIEDRHTADRGDADRRRSPDSGRDRGCRGAQFRWGEVHAGAWCVRGAETSGTDENDEVVVLVDGVSVVGEMSSTSASAATVGGRLIQLVGDRDAARFSCEVTRVCAEPHPGRGGPGYGQVLAWVVDAIVGVVVARLGAAGPEERFMLDIHYTGGSDTDVDALPAADRWVLKTVSALFAEDLPAGSGLLTAAEHFDITLRAETLAAALELAGLRSRRRSSRPARRHHRIVDVGDPEPVQVAAACAGTTGRSA
ncbi:hypothetical protein [Rhodococcus opacus]|uniref:hypothetical protein n=1 Tax=Rhodococcus opacus TaxID=37919 RepID=UPI001F572D2C|nr:hypothetical protein [Rhodococcus opacus]UNN05039.1 hypothetical protein MOO23_39510 [Rhodococcus opacus]